MAYGKDIFRTKYREANEGLKIVQNNYLELDHEYQMLAKRVEKAIENIDLVIELIKQQPTEDDTWILNKLNGFKYLLNGGDE